MAWLREPEPEPEPVETPTDLDARDLLDARVFLVAPGGLDVAGILAWAEVHAPHFVRTPDEARKLKQRVVDLAAWRAARREAIRAGVQAPPYPA